MFHGVPAENLHQKNSIHDALVLILGFYVAEFN